VNESTLFAVQRLRNALRANALFSLVSGAVVALSSGWLAKQLADLPTLIVLSAGIGLIAFGVGVLAVSVAGARTVWRLGWTIAAADVTWIVGSIAALALVDLTSLGRVVITVVGVAVALLTVAEVRALRHLAPLAANLDSSRLETVRRFVEFDAPIDIGWDVVSDHELYGRLAPNLHAVEVVSDAPYGARRCTSRSGESWSETCNTFVDDHRFEVQVDTSDNPYSLAVMGAVFRVDALGTHRSRASAVFRYEGRATVRGAFLAAAMPMAFAVVLRRIANGWAAEAARRTTLDRPRSNA
jgi:hypothetical protein